MVQTPVTPGPRKSWIRRCFILAVSLLLFAAAALGVGWLVENSRGESVWKSYRGAAEGRGVQLFPVEESREVADGSNYAALPIFTELTSADESVRERAAARFRMPGRELRSLTANASRGRRFPLIKWRDALVEARWARAASDDPGRDVLQALERLSPVLDELRAAEGRTTQQFRRLPPVNGWPTYPGSSLAMELARVLQLRAVARLASNEADEAARDVMSLFRLREALLDDECLISGLVRTTLTATICHTLWEGLAEDKWSEEQLRGFEGRLAEVQLADDFAQAYSTERQVLNRFCEMLTNASIAERRRYQDAFGDSFLPPDEDDAIMRALKRWGPVWMPRGWFRQNQLWANQCVDRMLGHYVDRDGEIQQAVAGPPLELSRSGPPPYRFMQSQSLAVYEVVARTYLRTQTLLQEARLACALARWRRAQGVLPATLEELVPGYVGRIPRDVFDGWPLRYRREGDREFLLYSVGPNARDDGGTPEDDRPGGTRNFDWIWRSAPLGE